MRALVYLDLDDFGKAVKQRGWTEYSPNPISAGLSRIVEEMVEKHAASILFGLDHARGTEEALIFFSDILRDVLEEELENARKRVEVLGRVHETGTTVSIGVASDIPEGVFKNIKRQDIKKHPVLRLAHDALRKAKRKKNCVVWG